MTFVELGGFLVLLLCSGIQLTSTTKMKPMRMSHHSRAFPECVALLQSLRKTVRDLGSPFGPLKIQGLGPGDLVYSRERLLAFVDCECRNEMLSFLSS